MLYALPGCTVLYQLCCTIRCHAADTCRARPFPSCCSGSRTPGRCAVLCLPLLRPTPALGCFPQPGGAPRGGASPRCPCWCVWQLLLSAESCWEWGLLYPTVPLRGSLTATLRVQHWGGSGAVAVAVLSDEPHPLQVKRKLNLETDHQYIAESLPVGRGRARNQAKGTSPDPLSQPSLERWAQLPHSVAHGLGCTSGLVPGCFSPPLCIGSERLFLEPDFLSSPCCCPLGWWHSYPAHVLGTTPAPSLPVGCWCSVPGGLTWTLRHLPSIPA